MKEIKDIVVKRGGRKESFDERKLYASIYAACLTTGKKEKEAEEIAERVCNEVCKHVKGRKEILSDEIFRKVVHELNKIDRDIGFMYETHLDVS